MAFSAMVMGVSAGGVAALQMILPHLATDLPVPVMIVQHMRSDGDDFLARHLNRSCPIPVKEAEDKEIPEAGVVYLAPADYHLLVEPDRSFALSVGDRVHFSRPSVDVLFETAAEVYLDGLIGVILTGANADGAHGLGLIKQMGGVTVVQDPDTAKAREMPQAALETVAVDFVIPLETMGKFLNDLATGRGV